MFIELCVSTMNNFTWNLVESFESASLFILYNPVCTL